MAGPMVVTEAGRAEATSREGVVRLRRHLPSASGGAAPRRHRWRSTCRRDAATRPAASERPEQCEQFAATTGSPRCRRHRGLDEQATLRSSP
jgi:hypothetical protein